MQFLAIAGGWEGLHWGLKSNLCRSLELSQASQAQPENLLPLIIGCAVIQMLQALALCLTERECCPWGGWEGTQPPFTCTSDTHTSSSSSCATSRASAPLSWKGVTSMEVFSTGQKTSQISPSLPPDTFSCQPDSHRAVCIKIRCKSLLCRNIWQIQAFVLSQA